MEAIIAITVQLGAMSNMLGEIVEQVLGAVADVRIIGRLATGEDPWAGLTAPSSAEPDLLILREADPVLRPLLAAQKLQILTLSEDGRQGSLLIVQQRQASPNADVLTKLRCVFDRLRDQR